MNSTWILLSCFMLFLISVNLVVVQAAHENHSKNLSSKFLQRFSGSKKGDEVIGLHHIKQYLVKYGYLNPSHIQYAYANINNSNFDDALETAVKKYQVLFHLNVSGVLDAKTLSMMQSPRCGNSDYRLLEQQQHYYYYYFNNGSNLTNTTFDQLLPYKWNKRELSFAIKPGTRSDIAAGAIGIALATWDLISALTFVDGNKDFSSADLKFSFLQREHGDGLPFDGPGNVLAHAFYPPKGEIHFDAEENMVIGAVPKGIDMVTVALHEIGHAIGLEHSNIESSIMWPYLVPGVVKGLNHDDVLAIRALYPS